MDMDELLKLPWVRQKAKKWAEDFLDKILILRAGGKSCRGRWADNGVTKIADLYIVGFKNYDQPIDPNHYKLRPRQLELSSKKSAIKLLGWHKSAYMAGRAFATEQFT